MLCETTITIKENTIKITTQRYNNKQTIKAITKISIDLTA